MRFIIILAVIFTGILSSRPLKAEMTVNSGDLQLDVFFTGMTNTSLSINDFIGCYLKNLNTNRAYAVAYEPDASFFYQPDLFNTNGIAISKTPLGQQVGSHFNILDPEVGVKDSHLTFSRRTGRAAYLEYSEYEIEALPRTILHATGNMTSCSHQVSPLVFFKITDPGEYILQLHFQVFELTDNKTIKLVRFPPIEVKLSVTPEDLEAIKATGQRLSSSESISAPAHTQAIPVLQVKNSKVLNTTHLTLAFEGYDSPDSALESWIWALSQGDRTNMLQSLIPEEQNDFNQAFDGKTDDQIKDEAAKIRSQMSGYTVRKMDIVSDTQVILNFTFAGSDLVQKMIVKKIGNYWKVAGPSSDSAVISTTVPASEVDKQGH